MLVTPFNMYPSIFNRFPVIKAVTSKGRHFSTFFAHFGLPGYAPETIAVNVTRLERGFNACKTPRCIYSSIFNRFWDIASYWSKIATFSDPHLCLAAPVATSSQNFAKNLIYTKLEWMGYRVVMKLWQYVQPFWYSTSVWQTDRQTDVQPIIIYYVHQHSWRT